MSLNRLDSLPVELVHQIFNYLSAHEIFYAFSHLTDYLDGTLISYNRYLLNFRSILKCHFDVTCHSLRPDRVISLALSDDDDTPDQSELFFSHFNIEQFSHLQSFDMSLMNNDTCKKLVHLDKLKYLSSLELPRLFQPHGKDFDITMNKILPQLKRLMAYNTYYLLDNSLPNLYHLILKYCNYQQLSILFKLIPNLYSLDILLAIDNYSNWLNKIPVLTSLRKLVLNTYGEKLTMVKIKEFLSKMPNLIHFELDTEGSVDIIDGHQWKFIVSHLIIFDFRIHLLERFTSLTEETILQSFQSLFWLEDKHWFVAFDSSHIFTIPRFLSNTVRYPYIHWPRVSTSSDFCFDQYITSLHISLLNPVPHRLTNVTSLIFDTDEISTDIGSVAFVSLIDHLPLLCSVSFRDLSILKYLPNDVVFEKIRNLYVRDINTRANVRIKLDINRLCTVFPRLERLNMELTSSEELVLLIDRLKYLSIAKFELNHSSRVTRRWLIKNSRRLEANFTLKIINNKIHLWMNNDKLSNNNQMFKRYSKRSCNLQ